MAHSVLREKLIENRNQHHRLTHLLVSESVFLIPDNTAFKDRIVEEQRKLDAEYEDLMGIYESVRMSLEDRI